jgi:MFS family permease
MRTETEVRPALSPRAIMAVLVPLMAVVFIATLDQTIVATALPGIGRGLHDLAGVSWVATSYLLTSAVSTLILGKLGDMYGRKKVFQFSVVVFLAGSLAAGLAPSPPGCGCRSSGPSAARTSRAAWWSP